MKRAVFLDRDGTLIEEVGYVGRLEQVVCYPWTADVIRAFNRAGLSVVVITNQSGIARGYLTEAAVETVHRHFTDVMAEGGARIDAYYYCPHHPDGTVEAYALRCQCRKPAPGLIERAARELKIDPSRSFVVGDKWLDIGLARTVGARGILVRTGYGASQESQPHPDFVADVIVDNLAAAASWILQHL